MKKHLLISIILLVISNNVLAEGKFETKFTIKEVELIKTIKEKEKNAEFVKSIFFTNPIFKVITSASSPTKFAGVAYSIAKGDIEKMAKAMSNLNKIKACSIVRDFQYHYIVTPWTSDSADFFNRIEKLYYKQCNNR